MLGDVHGREVELAAVSDLLRRTEDGGGGRLLLEGEAGIGKSKLVETAVATAATTGFTVLAGASEESERAHPLSGVLDMLGTLGAAAHRATEAGDPIDELLDLVEGRAITGPVLLCLEDLHWSDADTLAFVRAAAPRLDGLPVAFITTTRPRSTSHELRQLVDRLAITGTTVVPVGPLGQDAIAAIARDVVGAEPGSDLRAPLDRAGGNPLYALELVKTLVEADAIVTDEGGAHVTLDVLPPSLRTSILRRAAALPVETVEVLRVAAILGSRFTVTDVSLVIDRPAFDVIRVMTPAQTAGLVVETGERFAFRHDLVRASIYEDLPLPARRAMHWHVADVFRAAGRDITDQVVHLLEGAQSGDRSVVDRLIAAAEELGFRGREANRRLWERAAELVGPAHPARNEILANVVSVRARSMRSSEAIALGTELLATPLDPRVEALVNRGISYAYANLGRLADAARSLDAVLENPAADEEVRQDARAGATSIALRRGRFDDAIAYAYEGGEPLSPDRFDSTAVSAGVTRAIVAGARGNFEDALAIQEGPGMMPETRSYVAYFGARMVRALLLADVDRFEEAIAGLAASHRQSQATGGTSLAHHHVVACGLMYLLGRWDEALVEGQISLGDGEESVFTSYAARAILIRIHLHRGETTRADELLASADELLSTRGLDVGADLLLWAQATRSAIDGRADEALGVLEMVRTYTADFPFLLGAWRLIWPDLVHLAVGAGRNDIAQGVVDLAVQAARNKLGSLEAAARRLAAIVSSDGDASSAAAEALAASGRLVEAAHALEEAGAAFARSADERAEVTLRRAFDAWSALGATSDADRVRARLRELGVRLGATGARARPTTGWEALTSSELRVVELVTEGLTNAAIGERLFISRRTVAAHLRSVFAKLGATSRAEVAAEATVRRLRPAAAQRSAADG